MKQWSCRQLLVAAMALSLVFLLLSMTSPNDDTSSSVLSGSSRRHDVVDASTSVQVQEHNPSIRDPSLVISSGNTRNKYIRTQSPQLPPLKWVDRDLIAQESTTKLDDRTLAPPSIPVADKMPSAVRYNDSERVLLISAVQRPEVMCPILQRIRRSGFGGKLVLLHRADKHSAKRMKDSLQDPTSESYCGGDTGIPAHLSLQPLELFSIRAVMRSPTYYPLIAAGYYLEQLGSSSRRGSVMFIDPTEVSWCGDVFSSLEEKMDPTAVYAAFSADWGYHNKQEAPGPGPYVLGGSHAVMHALLPDLARLLKKMSEEKSDSRSSIGKVILERLNRQTFPNAIDKVLPFPSPAVVVASERSCALVNFKPDQCSGNNSTVLMVVDKRRCARDAAADTLKGFCTTSFAHDVYTLPNSLGDSASRVQLITNEKIASGLRALRQKPEHQRISEMAYAKKESAFSKCPQGRRHALVGMASGYRAHDIGGFILSFFASADTTCTDLVLFVNAIPEGLDARFRHSVIWELIPDYPVEVRKGCPAVETRCEVYRAWLLRSSTFNYGMIFLTDVRDVFIQADPFKSLFGPKSRFVKHLRATSSSPSSSSSTPLNVTDEDGDREFLYIPPESYLTSTWSDFVFWPHVMFQSWMDGIFGASYRQEIQHTTLRGAVPSTNSVRDDEEELSEPLPIICSGLYMGTSRALLQALDAMLEVFRVTPCWFGADQAILTGMVYDGFRLAGFSHDIFLANPEYSVFHNGIQRHHDVLWRDGYFVNCDGEPYSLVHQVDGGRHPWMWTHAMAKAGGCEAPLAVFRPERRLIEQSLPPERDQHVAGLLSLPQASAQPQCNGDAASSALPSTMENSDSDNVILIHGNHWGVPYLGPTLHAIRASGCQAPIVIIAPHEQAFRELQEQRHYDQFKPLHIEEFNNSSSCLRTDQSFFYNALKFLKKKENQRLERVVLMSSMGVKWRRNIFPNVEKEKVYLTRSAAHVQDAGILGEVFERCGFPAPAPSGRTRYRAASFRSEFVVGGAMPMIDLLEYLIDFGGYSRCSSSDSLHVMAHRHGLPPFVHVWTSEYGPAVSYEMVNCGDKLILAKPMTLCGEAEAAVMIHPCPHF